ncbi:MAG: hypothetical protein ACKPKO_65325, partial [Candidatus Fonsibacter sp.]
CVVYQFVYSVCYALFPFVTSLLLFVGYMYLYSIPFLSVELFDVRGQRGLHVVWVVSGYRCVPGLAPVLRSFSFDLFFGGRATLVFSLCLG